MGGPAVRVLAAQGNLFDRRGTKGFAAVRFSSRLTGSMTVVGLLLIPVVIALGGASEGQPETAL